MAVISDLIEGVEVQDGPDGYEIRRVFHVTDLTGAAAVRLYNALQATGIPERGDAHPTLSALRVIERHARPAGAQNENAVVEVLYRVPRIDQSEPDDTGEVLVRVGATVQEVETERDKDGNQITVTGTYTYDKRVENADGTEETVEVERTETQVGTVRVAEPHPVIQVERRETAAPFGKATTYVGRVNSATWNGFDPRTLLCSAIEGQTDDGGQSWTVSYVFEFRAETWDAVVALIVPETERPPGGASFANNQIKKVRVYPEIAFSGLNISL